MAAYQIFTDATADVCPESMKGLPSVRILPMELEIGGQSYTYGPSGTISVNTFYRLQREGNFASTSQINPSVYYSHFQPCLEQGNDILYLCFSSGMSGTYQSAMLCLEDLRQRYPERNILCVDTLCAFVGEGFLVREAARKQKEGLDIHALARWVTEHRLEVCHWFTVDVFEHLRHGGRVSAAAAVAGSVLGIKPLLHVDDRGCLQVAEKPRGRKKAIAAQMERMRRGWLPDMGRMILIGHGDAPEAAEQLRSAVAERFPEAEIRVAQIGPIIGAHTGPGMLALVYWGSNR